MTAYVRNHFGRHAADTDTGGDWRDKANCRDTDPELFFAVGDGYRALRQIEQAKTVCRRCPVIEQCRTHAIEVGEAYGVWGGLSPEEIRQARAGLS